MPARSRCFGRSAGVVPGVVVKRQRHPQAKRPMTLVDLLNIPRVGDPQIIADGRAITFMLATADWPANRRVPISGGSTATAPAYAGSSSEREAAAERALVADGSDCLPSRAAASS